MSLEEIVKLISSQSGLDEEEVMRRIREKQREFYGLISPEGAAHLVARDLGISLVKREFVQISSITADMKEVNLRATVVRMFKKELKDGKRVANVILADESGEIRLVLWNEQIDEHKLSLGDEVEIISAIPKKNVFGEIELRVREFTRIKKIGKKEIAESRDYGYERASIDKVVPGKKYCIRACIVHVFRGNVFFESCPECGIIIKNSFCPVHGEVEPEKTLVVNTIIDDGYGNMRAVFFSEVAEKLVGYEGKEENIEELLSSLLGREIVLYGRVRKNENFNRLELIVDDFSDVNVMEEINMLMKELRGGG
jgi:replication factor A1